MSYIRTNEVRDLNDNSLLKLGEAEKVVDSLADLAGVSTSSFKTVRVISYHSGLAGGGGLFYWDASADKATHNGGTVIDPSKAFPTSWDSEAEKTTWFTSGVGTGAWVRQYDGAVNVKWFGAKGDGITDDTKAIQNALNLRGSIELAKETYLISETLVIYGNTNFTGNGIGKSIIQCAIGFDSTMLVDSSVITNTEINPNIQVSYIEFDVNSYSSALSAGIAFYRVNNVVIDSIYIHDCGKSLLKWGDSQLETVNIKVLNSRFERARTGDAVQGTGSNVLIENCYAFSIGDTCFATLRDFNPLTSGGGLPSNITIKNCTAKGDWVSGVFTGSGRSEQAGFAFGPYEVGHNMYLTLEGCIAENLYINLWAIVFEKLKVVNCTFKPHSNLQTGGVRIDGVEDVVIANNSFESVYSSADSYYACLVFFSQRNTYGASVFDAPIKYINVSDNIFLGNGVNHAVILSDDPDHTTTESVNICNNTIAGFTLPFKLTPLTGSGSDVYDNINISGNIIDNLSTTAVTINGVSAQYKDVSINNNITKSSLITNASFPGVSVMGETRQVLTLDSNVATTVHTVVGQSKVEIEAYVIAGDPRWSAIGLIVGNGGEPNIAWKSEGASCSITLTGNEVQVTQKDIGTQTTYVVIRHLS